MKRIFSISTQMAALLLALFALIQPAKADVPITPRNFTATAEGKPQYIQLTWSPNSEKDTNDAYNIYFAYGKTDNLSNFKKIASQRYPFKYAIKDLQAGTYTVFLRAENADGESERTDFRFVTLGTDNTQPIVKFITEPKKTATSGQEYVYEAKAIEKTANLTILYKLDGAPDGMTIDEKTGRVTWTPSKDGVYKFAIIAYVADKPDVRAVQAIELKVGQGGQQGDAIRFVSEPNRTGSAGKEYTYQPKVTTNDPSAKLVYRLDGSPDGMSIDVNTGLITWTPTKDGEYKVNIIVNIAGTDIKAIQSFVIVVGKGNSGGGDKDAIRFITKPLEIGCLNKEYIYDAEAVTVISSSLATYKLTASPESMTIDEKTGLVRWTPTKEGEYKVSIVATVANTLSATQSFTLHINTICDNRDNAVCTKIHGKVVDENGNLIGSGTVKAVRLDKDIKGTSSYFGKINDGNYSFAVAEGNYALFASGEGFVEEWYLDATSIDKATTVTATCGTDGPTADFAVMHREKPKNIVIEGTVTNENGEAVFSKVEFIVKDKNGADQKDMSGRFYAKTGEKGNYRIEIPENLTVIAHAIPSTDQYFDQYFEKVNNPEEATRLTLTENIVVNFVLVSRGSYQNGFAGLVRDSASIGINARVIAYRVVSSDGNKEPKRYEAVTVSTNDKGEFNVKNLIPGDYFLFAIPKEKQGFVPGYYKAADFAVAKWQDATHITVGEVMIDQVFEIILRTGNGMRGGAHLGGKISHRGGIAKSGAATLSETPLAGAYVIAYDANGSVSDYIFSDDQGNYNLSELTAGTYTLTTDKPGFTSMQTPATVDYEKLASVQVDIVVDAQTVSGVDEDVYVAANGGLVFPNPASNQVNVRLTSGANALTVRVINTLGSEVLRFNAETSGTDSIVSFDASSLSAGMYTINIQGAARTISVPLTIIR